MAERLIHILPEQVASQIAAGEVVERPASAIKELIDNSIDAGARNISIEIARGGGQLISVADDGCGMSRDDAILSLRRHATSKIRSAGDLAAIRTLGFRGEALASIASVSHLKLQTRREDDPTATELIVEGGNVEAAHECAIARGTIVEARELFFNTPARLKFLKSLATEQGAVAETLQRIALARHAIAFTLVADGRTLFALTRAASSLERVRQLFGPKLASRMLAFDLKRGDIRVWGLAATSQESFASPRMMFTFVNGRVVRDRMLTRAIAQAYQSLLPRGRHPAALLFVEMRPEEVDVNVHPMKVEVRFRNSGAVFEAVFHALRDRLADQTESSRLSAAVAANIPPNYDSLPANGRVPTGAVTEVSADFDQAEPLPIPASERNLRLVPDAPISRTEQRPLGVGFDRQANSDTAPGPAIPIYSQLRVLGQIFAGYIALEHDDGLLLVDQHAAHERVTFERLRAELRDGGIKTQAMLTAQPIEINPARAAQVQALLPELRAVGFDVESFGAATLLLKGAPAVFGPEAGARLLSDMIASMGDDGFRLKGEAAFEDMLKQLACHGS
ncbi:MAG TPA: DNA mismatch repair endonuclease MutL, partial [Candidatus Binataceae bacterium]